MALWKNYFRSQYNKELYFEKSVQFSTVESCLTLCDPMNRSTPGLPVHHQLPEFTQTHIHWVKWCHPAISSSVIPFSSCHQSFPASESFPLSQHFAWGGQSTGDSALASFLPKKSQGWSPSEWTGWISLQSKGLSREAEDIKKRWQEYTEELYKEDLHNPDNHDGVITQHETFWNVKSSGP